MPLKITEVTAPPIPQSELSQFVWKEWFQMVWRHIRWKFWGVVNVMDFGAKGDGLTDDTQAVNNAIAYLNEQGTGVLHFPTGRYSLLNGTDTILGNNIIIRGDGKSSVLLGQNNNLLNIGDDDESELRGIDIRDLTFEYQAAVAGLGATCIYLQNCARITIQDLYFQNINLFLVVGEAGNSTSVSGIFVNNVQGWCFPYGEGGVISLRRGAGFFGSQLHFFTTEAQPTPPAAHPVTYGTHALQIGFDNWDTCQLQNCLFEMFDIGIAVDVSASVASTGCYGLWLDNVVVDIPRRYGIFLKNGATQFISHVKCTNCSFSGYEESGIRLEDGGAGIFANITFDHCDSYYTGGHAVYHNAPTATQVKFIGCSIYAANRLSGGTNSIQIVAGATDWQVIGCLIGYITTPVGLPYRGVYGISIGADCDVYTVADNRIGGSTAAFQVAANTFASANRQIRNNYNPNYRGVQAGGIYVLPASTVAWNNTTPYQMQIHIHGGTVTVIAKNGTTITGMTSGNLIIEPGESFTVTYSSAPSVTWFNLI